MIRKVKRGHLGSHCPNCIVFSPVSSIVTMEGKKGKKETTRDIVG
jgi:hypothetical protein